MRAGAFDRRLRLLLITPDDLGEDELYGRTADALAGGVRAVQLRCKRWSGMALWRMAERLRRLTDEAGALLLVNGRADIARAVGADGVHAGSAELPLDVLRRLLGPESLVGFSAHGNDDAAQFAVADYVTFSPVYRSPGKGEPVGTVALRRAVEAWAPRPVLALGGVEPSVFAEIAACGAAGVALIRSVYGARDVAAAAADSLAALEEKWNGATHHH